MGDDSERADRAPDAGTSDDGSSGGDESGSDPADGTPTDDDTPASDPPDSSDDDALASDPPDSSDDDAPASDSPDSSEDDAPASDSPDSSEDDAPASDSDDAAGDESGSDKGPTEVDAAETVDQLRNGDDADTGSEGDADADTNDGSTDDATEPPEVADIDPDGPAESEPRSGFESVGSRGDEAPDGDDVTDEEVAAADTSESGDSGDIWPGDEEPPADAAAVTGTDGGTTATAGGTAAGTAESGGSLVDDGLVSDGPETDEEMPLADHIEEMIRRLAVVLGVGGIVTLLLYPGADLANSAFGLDLVSSTEVIDFLWNKHVPGAPEITDRRPRIYGPLELLLTELKVAALGGLVVGLPVFVYETYLFMRPGLYPKERRYYLAAVPTSIVLAFVGISFAHFIVLPAIFAYFTSYTTGTAVVAFGLKETFNLILILMGYNAIIFQIPLFIMLAIMMNLVTRTWLEARRLLFWGAFLGLAFLVSPDPTGMAPIIIAATMIALFEGTLLALRWTASGAFVVTAERLAARRPQAVALAALVGYLLSPLPVPGAYYDRLPAAAVEVLAANGLTAYTPVIIAGIVVGAFELVGLLLRRFGRSQRALRVRLAVDTARRPVWLVAAVVGYLGSPDPVVLRLIADLRFPPVVAGGVAVGLVVGYEALRAILARREDRGD